MDFELSQKAIDFRSQVKKFMKQGRSMTKVLMSP